MVSSVLVGGICIAGSKTLIEDNSVQIMNSICGEQAQRINNTIGRIEQMVEVLSFYVKDNLDDIDKLQNSTEYRQQYMEIIEELVYTSAHETEGAYSVYVRINPELATTHSGIFLVKDYNTGDFLNEPVTDILSYSPDDTEHVGWYYEPIKAGEALWMEPYYNKNVNTYMISYVMPIYCDETVIGVVGMDVDFDYLIKTIDKIKAYDTGMAFLTDLNFNIIHHKNINSGVSILEFTESFKDAENASTVSEDKLFEYTFNGVEKQAAFEMLDNGMCLAITVPASEIDHSKNEMIIRVILIAVVMMVVFTIVAVCVSRKIVKPLKELDKAAQKIAEGDLDVDFNCKTKDEVGTLTNSFKETVNQLKIRIDYINQLAYTDKLTDTYNNTAYIHSICEINELIANGETKFSVSAIDLNGLKNINDNYGHDSGNKLLITASDIICKAFGRENVYRTGGDEFAVILTNDNIDNLLEYEERFYQLMKEPHGDVLVSAALGSAVYDSETDIKFENVFKRADELMYIRKKEMKKKGETSKILK